MGMADPRAHSAQQRSKTRAAIGSVRLFDIAAAPLPLLGRTRPGGRSLRRLHCVSQTLPKGRLLSTCGACACLCARTRHGNRYSKVESQLSTGSHAVRFMSAEWIPTGRRGRRRRRRRRRWRRMTTRRRRRREEARGGRRRRQAGHHKTLPRSRPISADVPPVLLVSPPDPSSPSALIVRCPGAARGATGARGWDISLRRRRRVFPSERRHDALLPTRPGRKYFYARRPA
jgi:hypothetical protein